MDLAGILAANGGGGMGGGGGHGDAKLIAENAQPRAEPAGGAGRGRNDCIPRRASYYESGMCGPLSLTRCQL